MQLRSRYKARRMPAGRAIHGFVISSYRSVICGSSGGSVEKQLLAPARGADTKVLAFLPRFHALEDRVGEMGLHSPARAKNGNAHA